MTSFLSFPSAPSSPARSPVGTTFSRPPTLSFSRPKILKRHTAPNGVNDWSVIPLPSLTLETIPEGQGQGPLADNGGCRKLRKPASSSGLLNDFKSADRKQQPHAMVAAEDRTGEALRLVRPRSDRGSAREQESFHPFDVPPAILDAFGFPGDFQSQAPRQAPPRVDRAASLKELSFGPFDVPPSIDALLAPSARQNGGRTKSSRAGTGNQAAREKRETLELPMQRPAPHSIHAKDIDKQDMAQWEVVPSISSSKTALSSVDFDLFDEGPELESKNRLSSISESSRLSSHRQLDSSVPVRSGTPPALAPPATHPFRRHLQDWGPLNALTPSDLSPLDVEENAMQELEDVWSALGVRRPVQEPMSHEDRVRKDSTTETGSIRSWRQVMKMSRSNLLQESRAVSPSHAKEAPRRAPAERSPLSASFPGKVEGKSTTTIHDSSSITTATSMRLTDPTPPIPARSAARGIPPKLERTVARSAEQGATGNLLRSPIRLHRTIDPPAVMATSSKVHANEIPIHQRPLPPLPVKVQSKPFLGAKPLARFLRARGLSTSSDPTMNRQSGKLPLSPTPSGPPTGSPESSMPQRRLSARDEPPARLPSHKNHKAHIRPREPPMRRDDMTALSFLALESPPAEQPSGSSSLSPISDLSRRERPESHQPRKQAVQHILPPEELSRIMDDHRAQRGLSEELAEDGKSVGSTKAEAGGWSSEEDRERFTGGTFESQTVRYRKHEEFRPVHLEIDLGMTGFPRLSPIVPSGDLPRMGDRSHYLGAGRAGGFLSIPEDRREVMRGSLSVLEGRRRGPVPPARPLAKSTPPGVMVSPKPRAQTYEVPTEQSSGAVSGVEDVKGLPRRKLFPDSAEMQDLDGANDSQSRSSSAAATAGTGVGPDMATVDQWPTNPRSKSLNERAGRGGASGAAQIRYPIAVDDFGSAFGVRCADPW